MREVLAREDEEDHAEDHGARVAGRDGVDVERAAQRVGVPRDQHNASASALALSAVLREAMQLRHRRAKVKRGLGLRCDGA